MSANHQAFPSQELESYDGRVFTIAKNSSTGLTKREYFAVHQTSLP